MQSPEMNAVKANLPEILEKETTKHLGDWFINAFQHFLNFCMPLAIQERLRIMQSC